MNFFFNYTRNTRNFFICQIIFLWKIFSMKQTEPKIFFLNPPNWPLYNIRHPFKLCSPFSFLLLSLRCFMFWEFGAWRVGQALEFFNFHVCVWGWLSSCYNLLLSLTFEQMPVLERLNFCVGANEVIAIVRILFLCSLSFHHCCCSHVLLIWHFSTSLRLDWVVVEKAHYSTFYFVYTSQVMVR